MKDWSWLGLHKINRSESETLEIAAMAVESLFVTLQGHAPSEQYEDGYADAIAHAAEVIRSLKS
jgi:hypothetical protein